MKVQKKEPTHQPAKFTQATRVITQSGYYKAQQQVQRTCARQSQITELATKRN